MNPEQSNESSIERLKRTLYSRDEKVVPKEKRTPVSGHEVNVPENWGKQADFNLSPDSINPLMTKSKNSFFNKFLLYSFLFFLVALGIAGFIFYGGLNMISSNNLDVQITAPSSIASGEELLVGLSVINGNRTDLENAVLYIDYPEGSQSVGLDSKSISRESVSLGTIPSGGVSEHTTRVIISGEKDALKTFNFRIEYRVKGSSAIFSKEKIHNVSINSSPFLILLSSPKEVNSGQEFTLSIDITSNSNTVMKNTLVKVEYPYGFTYKNSSMKPLRNNSLWNIGDLKNGDKKTISITGSLVGQDLEDRTFNVSLGSQSSDIAKDFDTALSSGQATIGVRKSFFGLSLEVDQKDIRMGQSIPVTIKWQNTLPDKIIDVSLKATLSGNALNRSSVSASIGGFYRSADNTILWDKNGLSGLSSILPGDSGQASFSVNSPTNPTETKVLKNPHIDVRVVIVGNRSGTDTSEISSVQDMTIKIPTDFTLVSKVFRNIGPFVNSGPIPPRADKESTYTITWTLTNTANDLKDTIVSAKLPAGVSWKGEISPLSEKISFNADTGVISWNVGPVSAGVGVGYSPREVSFKVGLVPSVSQVGQTPNLLTELIGTATDTYAEVPLSVSGLSVTTQYSDPGYKNGDNIVTK